MSYGFTTQAWRTPRTGLWADRVLTGYASRSAAGEEIGARCDAALLFSANNNG